MKNRIRSFAKNTVLYKLHTRRKRKTGIRNWSAQDQALYDFYAGFIRPGDLVFDVGANIGNRTKIFLRLEASVIAIEPQKSCVLFLEKMFGKDPRVRIENYAMGEKDHQLEMLVSGSDTLSSLSEQWIRSVKESGRFENYRWEQKETVAVTTLDSMIQKHGMPDFVKIDVEGYEYEVIKGLTQPVKYLSFEFTPEYIDAALDSIRYLAGLGEIRLNYGLGEKMELCEEEWQGSENMISILEQFRNDVTLNGDIYAGFADPDHQKPHPDLKA